MTQYYGLDIRVNYLACDRDRKLPAPRFLSFDHYPIPDGTRPHQYNEVPLIDRQTGDEYVARVNDIHPSSNWKRNARISAQIDVETEDQFQDVMRVLNQYK